MKKYYNSVDEPVCELTELVYNHFGRSPMSWTQIDKYTEYAHNNQFVELVLSLYSYLRIGGNKPASINPSQLYKIIYKFQLASKELDYDVALLEECYLYFANYAITLYNLILNETERSAKNLKYTNVNSSDDRKKIGYLSAVIRSFSEIVYCDEHTIAGEIISPIRSPNNEYIIRRKFSHLNAFELYPELLSFPYESVDLYYVYQGGEPPCTDIVGNILTSDNISERLIGYCIITTSKGVKSVISSESEIDTLIGCVLDFSTRVLEKLKNMNLEERLWKKIECEYYSLKDLTEIIGIDWHPQKYDVSIPKISDLRRPVVKVNHDIALLTNSAAIKNKLFELNDPRVHWSRI